MADAAQPDHPRQVAEAALAHKGRNQIEAAYRRTDLFEHRRRLMGELGGLLSWRARRPGDRQCARSSKLSRRWRLRQQCRHSTLGSARLAAELNRPRNWIKPRRCCAPPPIAPRPSWTCHSRQLQSTISLRWTSSEAVTRQNEAAFYSTASRRKLWLPVATGGAKTSSALPAQPAAWWG